MSATFPSPREIAKQVFDDKGDRLDLGAWLGIYLSQLGVAELPALEMMDDLQPRVAEAIDRAIGESTHRGVRAPFIWADDDHTVLARPALFANDNDAEVEYLAAKTRNGIFDALGFLTGSQFEFVCLHLVHIYGIDPGNSGVIGRTGDEGMDFYGALLPYKRPGPDRLYTLGWRFLGQAKLRFNKKVNSDDVAAFGTRLDDLRLGKQAPAKVPKQFLELEQPLTGLLITAGQLPPSARKAARRHVIAYIEGDQVAEDLSRSPEVQTWLDPVTTNFDRDRFLARFTP